jgi:peptide/nickel transport system permease protein
MFAYTVRRIIAAIPVLIAASFIVFWLTSFAPDPVAQKFGARNPPVPQNTWDQEYQRLGLKDGFWQQYWDWLWRLVVGSDEPGGRFGPSTTPTMRIDAEIFGRLGTTLRLIAFAMLIALVLAIVAGVLSAVRQYSKTDYTLTFTGFVLVSMPTFWVAVLLKEGAIWFNETTGTTTFYTLGEKSVGIDKTGWAEVSDIAGHMFLPTMSLALLTYAAWSRFQRSSMLEVLNSDYIRLARAKGLRWRTVLVRHGLRTALIPMATVSSLTIAGLIGGAVITESVYQWNGMGRLIVQAIVQGDRNVILAWLMLAGLAVVVGNLVADLIYGVLDPRIRYE